MDIGGITVWRETFHTSLKMAEEVLKQLGLRALEAERAVATFEKHDENRLRANYESHTDQEKMIYLAREAAKELEELFNRDLETDEPRSP
jgi:Fe2+ transport system protein B